MSVDPRRIVAVLAMLAAPIAIADEPKPTDYRCGSGGSGNRDTGTCDCPGSKVSRRDGRIVTCVARRRPHPVVRSTEPVDAAPAVSASLDGDADGLPDETDRCPALAESVNRYEDEDGCPDEEPPFDATPSPDQPRHEPTTGALPAALRRGPPAMTFAPRERTPSSHRRAVLMGGAAAVLLGASLGVEFWARADYRAYATTTTFPQAQLDAANRKHYIAQGLAVGGVGVGCVAVWLWFHRPPTHRPALVATPVISPGAAGGAVQGYF